MVFILYSRLVDVGGLASDVKRQLTTSVFRSPKSQSTTRYHDTANRLAFPIKEDVRTSEHGKEC